MYKSDNSDILFTYLAHLKLKVCAAKIDLGRVFQKSVLQNSDVMAGERRIFRGFETF